MSVQQSYEESQEQNPEKEKQIIFREIAKTEAPIKWCWFSSLQL